MDKELKRGLLDICVLKAISYKETYGYEIIKELKPYIEISESTLYPILRRLEGSNLLTEKTLEHNGRLRKYYHITKLGEERILEFKNEWEQILKIHDFIIGDEKHA